MKKLAILLFAIISLSVAQAGEIGRLSAEDATRAIVGEAANQGASGMLAVACAIRNRGSLQGVFGLHNKVADKQPAWVWKQARSAWQLSATKDTTSGATHWENTKAFGTPYWAKGMEVTVVVKDHRFYRKKTT